MRLAAPSSIARSPSPSRRTDVATETFDICAEFPYTRMSWRPAVSTPDGSPLVRSRDVNERELRIYKIEWSEAPRQIIERIKDLYVNRVFGPTIAMNFTPTGESEHEVRFKEATFQYRILSAVSVSCELELEEVR